MILIADGGSTKTDWIALDNKNKEIVKVQSLGLNPSLLDPKELTNRLLNVAELMAIKDEISKIYFYGAGCGTLQPSQILHEIMQTIFPNATIQLHEDMLAAVLATSGNSEAIVCILGTGSNSCYYDGKHIKIISPSLGYTIMDEASGNYFGKLLIRDYYYKTMPNRIANYFSEAFHLDPDYIKQQLYREQNPNRYLASFAKFMYPFKEEEYIRGIILKGFHDFFTYRIIPFKKDKTTPLYFIGSIAYYFRDLLEEVAQTYDLHITNILQRPIDGLVNYHKDMLNK